MQLLALHTLQIKMIQRTTYTLDTHFCSVFGSSAVTSLHVVQDHHRRQGRDPKGGEKERSTNAIPQVFRVTHSYIL